MTTVNTMHDASNKLIARYVQKQNEKVLHAKMFAHRLATATDCLTVNAIHLEIDNYETQQKKLNASWNVMEFAHLVDKYENLFSDAMMARKAGK